MIWLDARAEKEAEILRERTELNFITAKAPSAKVFWIKRNEPEIYARTHKMLDCKDYLQYRMTGVYATDITLASATTYFNPWEGGWWTEVLEAMELPVDRLPELVLSTSVLGGLTKQAAAELGLAADIPVVCGGGDVPCAAVGAGAISPGRSHLYLGTSAWVVAMTPEPVLEVPGLYPGGGCDPSSYVLCGEMDNAGGCVKWFRENFICREDEQEAEKLGISVLEYMDRLAEQTPPGAEGLLFLPWLWGERAPVDDDNVRGGFANLGLNHKKGHFIRAILEGTGHHLRWIFSGFDQAGVPREPVNVIGGGAAAPIWLQILADVTGRTLRQVEQPLEACARGAAMTAAVGLGYYVDFAEVESVISLTGAEFTPNPALRDLYDQAYANFRSLYQPLSDIGNRRVEPMK
jgi:xylulokinase